jgi:tRNA (cytidine/uridine-2'-O-)-methyltransferase
MRMILFEPDMPQNLGSAIRLCACLGVELDIIEPCGFALSDKAIRRVSMDYGDCAKVTHHPSWARFHAGWRAEPDTDMPIPRLILFTTKAALPYASFVFRPSDMLLFGRESAGVPDFVHAASDARLYIPMQREARSLNVINSAAMALGEALRQTDGFTDLIRSSPL